MDTSPSTVGRIRELLQELESAKLQAIGEIASRCQAEVQLLEEERSAALARTEEDPDFLSQWTFHRNEITTRIWDECTAEQRNRKAKAFNEIQQVLES